MPSKIYAYNAKNGDLTNNHKRFTYLDGSQDLHWEGIQIESLEAIEPVSGTIFFKDYYFSMSLKDIEFQVNDTSIGTKSGDIFITPRHKSFDLVNNSAFSMIRCTMTHEFLKAHFYDKNIDHLKFTENYSISDSNIQYLLLLIFEQSVHKTSFRDPYLNLLFDAFVTHYIKDYSNYNVAGEEGMLDHASLVQIDRYIDDNLAENITSVTLAELVSMSNYTFLNEFKQQTNDTPHQYILKKKLEAGKKLLKDSTLSILMISHQLGFTDSSHFSKFFKKQVGTSPSNYRKG